MILEVAILNVRNGKEAGFEVGFRGSPAYSEWKKRLHHFYDPFPTVEHYVGVSSS